MIRACHDVRLADARETRFRFRVSPWGGIATPQGRRDELRHRAPAPRRCRARIEGGGGGPRRSFEGARPRRRSDPGARPTYFWLAGGDDHTDASDLVAALRGLDPNAAWISRLSVIVPAGAFGDDLAVTRRDDQRKSPFVVATEGRAGCPVPDGGPIGPEGGRGGSSLPPPFPPPRPPEPPGATDPGTLPPTTPPHQSPVTSVQMSCSCSPEPGAPDPSTTEDSCDGSDPGDASDSDEGCDGSADDRRRGRDGSSDRRQARRRQPRRQLVSVQGPTMAQQRLV
jgi:hypothetical protein